MRFLITNDFFPHELFLKKWDNTDIRSARNIKKWLPSDKQYKEGGYRKEQSFSVFGYGEGEFIFVI